MRLNVTFKTDWEFDESKHPVGEEVAEKLSKLMSDNGIVISNIDNYEDFAWALDTRVGEKELFLLLGHVGDDPEQWLIQVASYQTKFLHMFNKKHAIEQMHSLAPKVHAVLASCEKISNILWHHGDFADGTPSSVPNHDIQ